MKDTGPPAFAPTFDLLLAAVLSGVVFILAHLKALTNPYVVNDDVRQQLFWMQQWLDPELFKGDLLADYARDYVPWGVKGLYWLASWVTDPISFSKVLPGLLFVFLALCLYRIGLKLGDRRLAWTDGGGLLADALLSGQSGRWAGPGLCRPPVGLFLAWLARRNGPGAWALPSCCRPCSFPISFW